MKKKLLLGIMLLSVILSYGQEDKFKGKFVFESHSYFYTNQHLQMSGSYSEGYKTHSYYALITDDNTVYKLLKRHRRIQPQEQFEAHLHESIQYIKKEFKNVKVGTYIEVEGELENGAILKPKLLRIIND